MKKLQTIDEFCGKPKSSFKKFIKDSELKKYIYVIAVVCPNCKDTIYSRANHDFNTCSCGETHVDGGFEYIRVGYKSISPERKRIRVYATKHELYEDWNNNQDKFGRIPAK